MFYRIHPANEAPETCLNPSRPTGWTVDGEGEIEGVACLSRLNRLQLYASNYGMCVGADDLILEVDGRHVGGGHDGVDDYVIARSVKTIGVGAELAPATALAEALDSNRMFSWPTDTDDIEMVLDDADLEASEVTDNIIALALMMATEG